jgi:hypothetical protein
MMCGHAHTCCSNSRCMLTIEMTPPVTPLSYLAAHGEIMKKTCRETSKVVKDSV